MQKQKMPKLPEKEIQSFILDFLKVSRIGYFWRNNTVGVFDPVRKIYRKNAKQEKGIADILGVMHGRFVAIECKATGINKLSEDQEKYKYNVNQNNGIFYLANDIDAFSFWIKDLNCRLSSEVYKNL